MNSLMRCEMRELYEASVTKLTSKRKLSRMKPFVYFQIPGLRKVLTALFARVCRGTDFGYRKTRLLVVALPQMLQIKRTLESVVECIFTDGSVFIVIKRIFNSSIVNVFILK